MKVNPILIFNSIQLFFFFGNFLFVASQADSKHDVGSRGIDSNQTTDDLYDIKGELSDGGNEYQNHDPEHDRTVVEPMDKALAVVYVVLTIVGLLANGIVFFVIFGRNEINKTITALYVVQLALADSLFLISLPVFGIQKITLSWTFGSAMCTICQTLKFFNYYAGIFFLTAMSVDRCLAVTYGARAHQLRTKKRTVLASAIVWLASAIMSLPIAIFAKAEEFSGLTKCAIHFPGRPTINQTDYYYLIPIEYYTNSGESSAEGNGTESQLDNATDYDLRIYEKNIPDTDTGSTVNLYSCSHQQDHRAESYISWVVANFIVGFLVPFLIISFSYVLILKKLQSTEQKVANMTGKKTVALRRKVTRMVASLVVCFVICWLPYHVFLLMKIRGIQISVSSCVGIEQFFVAMGFSNSAFNPILYTFLGPDFISRFRQSVTETSRRMRRSSFPSLTGYFTRSHSDHRNHSFSKKSGKTTVFRTRVSSSGSHLDDKRMIKGDQDGRGKYQGSLIQMSKRKGLSSVSSDQNERSDYVTSRYVTNQTELSRVAMDTKQ